jgi:hypothetical protein
MSGAIPPLPHYVFMAWCSAKAQGQLYLYLQVVHDMAFENVAMNFQVKQKQGISSPPQQRSDFEGDVSYSMNMRWQW